jgi:predicted TIM-barrel fold metal-dependent hydrolase
MDKLALEDYLPKSKLVVPEHPVEKPFCPVIDAHNHLFWGASKADPAQEAKRLLALMDEAGVQMIVDLTRAWDDSLQVHLDALQNPYPDRFTVFACVDWDRLATEGDFGAFAARSLEDSAKRGARGLKIFKNYGLTVHDGQGKLVAVDDERVAPLCDKAGELGLPVLIHVADPVAFFDPLDRFNERYEELQAHPSWHFYGPEYPSFLEIMDQLARLVERHPGTTFIGAHVGCYSENLAYVSDMLDRCPNFYVDISARISELGRQPFTARRFFLKYPDRILFGTDVTPDVAHYRVYYRFVETEGEYMNYGISERPGQGRWYIYGVNLPPELLRKVYYENARRVLGLQDIIPPLRGS